MSLFSWLPSLARNRSRQASRLPGRVRPVLEMLEDRLVPTMFNVGAGDVAGLIADINTANSNGQSNVINLTASTYDLTAINNFWYGPDGLPAISSNLAINGNGATLQRDTTAPDFRLFYVSGGLSGLAAGNLTLNNLTLQGGVAKGGNSNVGGAGLGAGGAIFNQGSLALNGVTLTANTALGGSADGTNSGGGGGMGEDAPDNSNGGGGFGNNFSGFGGAGGAGNGGGGGFNAAGGNAAGTNGGAGGGLSGLGGNGGNSGNSTGGTGGDGGGGAAVGGLGGGNGGNFGNGGGGGGGGVGGGGARGGGGGFGGGGGGDNGGTVTAGAGGFGGGGGGGGQVTSGNVGGFAGGNGSNGTGGGGGGLGGALFNMYGVVSLTNCTLAGNTAQGGNALRSGIGGLGGSGYGGAVFNLDGTLNLIFCTVADNTVAAGTGDSSNGAAGGGAVYNLAYGNTIAAGAAESATATITDSILSDSTSGVDLVNNVVNGNNTNTATATLNGPNLVQTSSGAISGTTPFTADPQLGPLQNNGGPTPTMALTSSSPAFQAGIPVSGVTTDQRGVSRPNTPSLGAFEVLAATTTTASGATATFSNSAQNVTLTADVTSTASAVNEGTVTFTVLQGFTVIGTATTSGTVSNGQASLSYVLPTGTAAATYTIDAVYNPGADFTSSQDDTHSLIVSAAATTTAASNATATFSESAQDVTLSANVTSGAGAVNEGTVTFTVLQGFTVIGTATTSGTVSNGQASLSYVLPTGTAAATYTIDASYSDSGGNFAGSKDDTHTLFVNPALIGTAAGMPLGGFERTPLVNVAVATFNAAGSAGLFSASISWGDGAVTTGTVTPTGAGSFAVLGSHDYTDEGSFAVSVTITGPSNSTTVGAGATLLEELLPDGTRGTPNERFISEVYRDLLGRPVDAGGLATWSGLLDQGVSRLQVVTLIEHDPGHEFFGVEVTAAYQQFLHRDPDPGGLPGFVNFLAAGGTVEQMDAVLASSPEYLQFHAGETNNGFVTVLYQDALARAVEPSALQALEQALAAGLTPQQVALAILSSPEYRGDLVQQDYLHYLDRAFVAGPDGASALTQFPLGTTDEAVIALILGDSRDEFFNKTAG